MTTRTAAELEAARQARIDAVAAQVWASRGDGTDASAEYAYELAELLENARTAYIAKRNKTVAASPDHVVVTLTPSQADRLRAIGQQIASGELDAVRNEPPLRLCLEVLAILGVDFMSHRAADDGRVIERDAYYRDRTDGEIVRACYRVSRREWECTVVVPHPDASEGGRVGANVTRDLEHDVWERVSEEVARNARITEVR